MSFVTSEKMLLDAQKGGYAVPAFNVENLEMAQAVIAAAEELRSPIMMQTTPSTVKYGTLAGYVGIVKALAEKASVPICLHLDHGKDFNMAVQAVREGYTSIMIDGSKEEFEKNIAITKAVVDVCKPSNIPVEAELGKVGGKEDDMDNGENNGMTVPAEAAEFVERTGVSSLAVAIGTAHGVYKGVPKLDKDRLAKIRQMVSIPLVLHGASGIPDQDVWDCVALGICKVNIATELRIAFSEGVKAYLQKDPEVYDPKKYAAVGRENVKTVAMKKIMMCGSNEKA